MSKQPETEESEVIEPELITESDTVTALMALNKSEIDQQISTAKKYPRSIKEFRRQALEMACLDEETAGTMFYVLPRAGKRIEGPSVRLAEVIGSSWGNVRYGARIVGQDDRFITAQGACFDLEKNISIAIEIRRRITDKHGRIYNDDMIQTTCNAACSIALRQAIFKIVPFSLIKPIYEQARQTSVGKADSMQARRARALEWFTKAGASQEQVLQALGRAGIDDITMDDLITLTGFRTAIKDGDTTIEKAFGAAPQIKKRVKRSPLNDTLATPPASQPAKDEPRELVLEREPGDEPPEEGFDRTKYREGPDGELFPITEGIGQ